MRTFFRQFVHWIIKPHSILVTIVLFLFIGVLDMIRFNLHFLDPFNNGLKDYEVTDIVYSRLEDRDRVSINDEIILVNTGQPNRETLNQMLQKLHTYRPRAIGMDVLLGKNMDPVVDTALRNTMASIPNLVLGTQLGEYIPDREYFAESEEGNPFFLRDNLTGYTNFLSADNMTVRMFSPFEQFVSGPVDAFAVAVAREANPEAVRRLADRHNQIERINYIGSENFTKVSAEVLLDSNFNGADLFRNKIVLMGYIGEESWAESINDKFYTPLNPKYTGRALPDMYGVVIHANIIAMILNGDYIYDFPAWLVILLEILFTYVNVAMIHWIYRRFHVAFHPITRTIQLLEFSILFFMTAYLFHYFQVRVDLGSGILGLALAYDFVMIYESLLREPLTRFFARFQVYLPELPAGRNIE
ncbi:MAG: CHASE2 domain-containing protein [Saprospiraceae bacterium]|nr:CHASE2 domain-containing protein [Saprospiraceae bacterium]